MQCMYGIIKFGRNFIKQFGVYQSNYFTFCVAAILPSARRYRLVHYPSAPSGHTNWTDKPMQEIKQNVLPVGSPVQH